MIVLTPATNRGESVACSDVQFGVNDVWSFMAVRDECWAKLSE